MKTLYSLLIILLVSACNGGSELETKIEDLKELKSDALEMQAEIKALEKEIKALDPDFGKANNNAILVTSIEVKPTYFEHEIEARGTVESRTNVQVSAQIPGEITAVKVQEGDYVTKGKVLALLDNEIIRNNIAELETALELATTIADKQQRLWKKNVGTEVQYLQAKNSKESLERKLATAKSQSRQAVITAPFSGNIDAVIAKRGEMAQPGMMLFRIVNPNDIRIKSDLSERFIGKFKKGDPVVVYFPSQDKQITSEVKSIGQVINSKNRTFEIEVDLPKVSFPVRANQVVVLRMKDYKSDAAMKLPSKLIQKDRSGSYVYQLKKEGEQLKAFKLYIKPGVSFKGETEIVSGLAAGQQIAYKGYRELSEGVVVKIAKSKTKTKTASK